MEGVGSPLLSMVRMLESRCDLGENARQALLDIPCFIRTLNAGSYVIREGDMLDRCFVLVAGLAYQHRVVGNGGRQIVAVYLAGDLLAPPFTTSQRVHHNVQALSPAKVASIDTEAFDALALRYPDIARAMWLLTLAEASYLREAVASLGRRDARERMAHLLCWLFVKQERAGLTDGNSFILPLTQEQIADTMGLTSVHVNRTLKQLESDGLIVRRMREVTIPDWDALTKAGDFSPAFLHLKTGAPRQ